MSKMTDEEINEHLESMAGWKREGASIEKTFKLPTFPAAIALVTHIGFLAEAAAHHPDIDIRYNQVKISLSTHDVGGISQKDFELAGHIDELVP
jgi:4a-hydroxytetrahydrobiopterin dehydratase